MAKVAKPAAPDQLTMTLFAPGMTALHRAGLGGLACTLKAMDQQHETGLLRADKLPGSVLDGVYPWDITIDSVTLKFGRPENAGAYLKKLFAFGFSITNSGLIHLPGQHHTKPSDAILADLQRGLTLTFLQHGGVRELAKEATMIGYDLGGEGVPNLNVEYKRCAGFKHQHGWKRLVDKNDNLVRGAVKVDGPISPGTVIRHVEFSGATAAEDPPARILPLYFALVGCLSLPVNRGEAALIVPDVDDLQEFLYNRPAMTPSTPEDCQIANAADAAFRVQVRLRNNPRRTADIALRARRAMTDSAIPACDVMTFAPTAWARKQKSRVATIHIPAGDDGILDRYQLAVSHLAPPIVPKPVHTSVRRGKQKSTTEPQESFLLDSVALVAENLALGLKWYTGFTKLMTRNELPFERRGLHAMIAETKMWDHDGERLVVEAVHQAIRQRMGQIRSETDDARAAAVSPATKNRWERFRGRLRLALCGAKTEGDVRFALVDLFSRAGTIPALRDGWQSVLPVMRRDWRLTRDLALLALASYGGKGEAATPDQLESTTPTEEQEV